MEDTQKFHPAALAVQEVCQRVHRLTPVSEQEVLGTVLPLTAVMMLFVGGKPKDFFSREFLAVLATEREAFETDHEFNTRNIIIAFEAEAKRILELD